MHRRAVVCGLVVVLGMAAGARAAPTPARASERAEELAAALNKIVKFAGFDDPKTTLAEALDSLAKRYDLAFDVNERGFKLETVPDVLKTEVAQPNPIPEMNATLDTVLKKVLARVPSSSGATFLIRRDRIEITTVAEMRKEVWGPKYRGPMLPLVQISFDKLTLREALRELAHQAAYNVVLDAAAVEKAKTPVTAKLRNAPLDVAVRLLADMADLRSVQVANTLYVTTPEKADALRAQLIAERPPERPKQAPKALPELPTGFGTGLSFPPKPQPKGEGRATRPAEKATKDAAAPGPEPTPKKQ
jgi:hypothetical protein